MFTKTTKSQAIEQFKYNWKVYTLRCKREGKKVTKLAKVFAWQDFTEFLASDGYITEFQRANWTNPYEYRNWYRMILDKRPESSIITV